MSQIVEPILVAESEGRLKEIVVEKDNRQPSPAPLEAFGRTLAGVAPWLELGPGPDPEGQLRARYIDLALKSIRNAVDPQSPGHLEFALQKQALVDTAFFCEGLLRAPKQLWGTLNAATRFMVVDALKSSRAIEPHNNNWLLFSAIVEAALLEFTGECEMAPIEKAITSHLNWYKGDGTYGDGPAFHWDYYNSLVIHPMLWEVLEICQKHHLPIAEHSPKIQARARRFAAILEMQISPEGSYPVVGRSATYRFGAFHLLSLLALRHALPESLAPAGVRSALNAVVHRQIEAPGTFAPGGLLHIGVLGAQPRMAESYINRGSLYLCTAGLLQLGLQADDPFWTEPVQPWTQKRIWSGEDTKRDETLKEGGPF